MLKGLSDESFQLCVFGFVLSLIFPSSCFLLSWSVISFLQLNILFDGTAEAKSERALGIAVGSSQGGGRGAVVCTTIANRKRRVHLIRLNPVARTLRPQSKGLRFHPWLAN